MTAHMSRAEREQMLTEVAASLGFHVDVRPRLAVRPGVQVCLVDELRTWLSPWATVDTQWRARWTEGECTTGIAVGYLVREAEGRTEVEFYRIDIPVRVTPTSVPVQLYLAPAAR
jgi:hypothetical protein